MMVETMMIMVMVILSLVKMEVIPVMVMVKIPEIGRASCRERVLLWV